MRRIIVFLSVIVMTLFMGTVVLAESKESLSANTTEKNKNISETFINFMDDAFNDLDGLTVSDADNQNATKEFIETSIDYYEQGDYEEIKKIIANKNLSISHQSTTEMNDAEVKKFIKDNEESINESINNPKTKEHVEMLMNNNIENISPKAPIGKNVTEKFYHLQTESTLNKFTDEWIVTLSGSYLYDNITGEKYGAKGPTTNFDPSFGALFSPSMNNVTTNISSSNNTIAFTASYDVTAAVGFSVGGLPIGFPLNYGSHTDTMIK